MGMVFFGRLILRVVCCERGRLQNNAHTSSGIVLTYKNEREFRMA